MSELTRLSVHVRVSRRTQNAYSEDSLLDRSVSVVVPPGVEPMDELHRIVTQEFGITKRAFEQFPVENLLEDKS